ncbi:MAG: transposase [Solirubrobacteraceae bacterium]
MPQNFIEGPREQGFLLPPDVRDWLPEDHLAWFVIEAVADMDLSGFYSSYRADGHGRAAYELSIMVAPVKPELIAVDGTRLQGNASPEANRDYHRIATEILAEAKATDEAEDELYGDARGDELPEQLQTAEGRRAFFAEAKRKAAEEEAERQTPEALADVNEMAAVVRAAGHQGREGWLREGRRGLEQRRHAQPTPIPRSRAKRLHLAKARLDEELDTDRRSNQRYEHYRAHARDPQGRGLGAVPKPFTLPEEPVGKVNITDPDSKQIKTNAGFGWVQGYNAQAVVGAGHIVLAAELTNSTNDSSQRDPMVTATTRELERAGVAQRPKVALADTGYWRESQIDEVIANKHIAVLIPPDGGNRGGPRPGWNRGRHVWMRAVLSTEAGQELYRRRKQIIEPVFAHTKHNRGITQFRRRGLKAVRTEWRLLMATHNLTKLHRHQVAIMAT